MMADDNDEALHARVADLYRGLLEDFVGRRDALAKQLRSAGDRESAAAVKALRKPARTAWALNLVALDDRHALESLVAAIAETADAQSVGGDVRAASAKLRGTVREFAGQAARAAGRAGHELETGELVNALLAVLGKTESFDQLRGGRLADIPEGGGLDLLAALPTPSGSTSTTAAPEPRESPPPVSAPAKQAMSEINVRLAARKAAALLADARKRAAASRRTLEAAKARLHAAEAKLRAAEAEAQKLMRERDRAREEADTAAQQLVEAEREAADAARRNDE